MLDKCSWTCVSGHVSHGIQKKSPSSGFWPHRALSALWFGKMAPCRPHTAPNQVPNRPKRSICTSVHCTEWPSCTRGFSSIFHDAGPFWAHSWSIQIPKGQFWAVLSTQVATDWRLVGLMVSRRDTYHKSFGAIQTIVFEMVIFRSPVSCCLLLLVAGSCCSPAARTYYTLLELLEAGD